MGFAQAVATCLRNYVTFSGRAPRSEYWWFILFVVLGQMLSSAADAIVFGGRPKLFGLLFLLATWLPVLAVSWRRMHDVGLPGWVTLTDLPFLVMADTFSTRSAKTWAMFIAVGFIVAVLVFLSRPSQRGPNRFGPEPARALPERPVR